MTTPLCPICAGMVSDVADLTVLGRHQRMLMRCTDCGHTFFHEPDWLEEAYAHSIASTDVGLVDRSTRLANVVTTYLTRYTPSGPCLDYAAGTGLMVRLLRDLGFDFRYHDLYGPNHLAKGFEVEAQPPERFSLVTAIEVAEHLVDPVAEFRRLASLTDAIVFTTSLAPDDHPPTPDWDYLSLGTGQHISFYSPTSLRRLADALEMSVVSRGDMHLLSRHSVSKLEWKLITTNTIGHLLAPRRRAASLIAADHAQALESLNRPG